MKILTRWMILGVFFPVLALGQTWSVTALVEKKNVSWEEALGAVLLADLLDLDATFILSTGRETQTSVFVLAPALVIYRDVGVDPLVLLRKHRQGKGWGVLAHELGVHPGVFNKTRVGLSSARDGEIEGAIWLSLLGERYGADGQVVSALRARGLGWGDVLAVIHIGHYSRKGPWDVVKVWEKRGKRWDKVCEEFGVSLEAPRGRKKEPKEGAGKGAGRGKGHGGGKPH